MQNTSMDIGKSLENQCLFVYGTLRQSDVIERLLGHRFQYLGCGWINGRLYNVRDYPGIKLNTSSGYAILGDILQLTEPGDWSIIDEYEGCAAHCDAPFEFIRQQHWLTDTDGSQRLAWVYVYQLSIEGLVEITAGDYLAYLGLINQDAATSSSNV